MTKDVTCTLMRGGTSKGAYFLKEDLPEDEAERDQFLLAVMGSPDDRQIDGLGGANPLTSKVAIVSKSDEPGIDVDYLFAQVTVDKPLVSYGQNCGNILAGIGPFAIEHGLVEANDPVTDVNIHMVNSGDNAVATISTPGGVVTYDGDAQIDGVPGTAAPVLLNFLDTAGAICGALLPTGNVVDIVAGVEVTCIDNGMPLVIMAASDFGITGYETVEELEANANLKTKLEEIRFEVGPRMNLGDVTDKTVPKMTLVAAPRDGGLISTRSFIPHRCHASIGVFAAVTAATACLIESTPAAKLANISDPNARTQWVEHPSGSMEVAIEVDASGNQIVVRKSGFVRTARKIFEGTVFGAPRSE